MKSSRTELHDDVVDVRSFSALDVAEIKRKRYFDTIGRKEGFFALCDAKWRARGTVGR